MKSYVILWIVIALLFCTPARAEETVSKSETAVLKEQMEMLQKNLEHLQKQHEAEIMKLQREMRELADDLEEQRSMREFPEKVLDEGFYDMTSSAVYEAQPASGRGLWQSFNPDISVIGDMLGQYTSHENEQGTDRPDDEFIFRELELDFSGALDPFARADVVVAIHREFEDEEHEHEDGEEEEHEHESPRNHSHEHGFAVHIEEAYLTALSLPHGLQARAGRIRERFGKTNQIHLHALPWIDYPLVTKNYFGAEGLMGDGAEVSWLAPTTNYLELAYEIFNNSNSSSFAGEEYDDFVHLVHAKNLLDFSDTTTMELGGTVATAPNDNGHGGSRTWLEGIDLTLKWRPLEDGLYKGVAWQSELLLSQKDTHEGEIDTWGMYSSLEYQFSKCWKAAMRYDYSEFPDFENFREHGISTYLTFMQSEYVFWRLGYMYVDRNFPDPVEEDEHRFWVQLDFGLGPHRAHAY